MGKLAELAGTPKLKGAVQVTCMQTGVSRTCADEAEALGVIGGAHVEHRRGAFFYGGEGEPVILLDDPKSGTRKVTKKKPRGGSASTEDPIG